MLSFISIFYIMHEIKCSSLCSIFVIIRFITKDLESDGSLEFF